MITYRTKLHKTQRILGDWELKERLAFNLKPSQGVADLRERLPERCKQQLGGFKPTDNVFRKMSSGFDKVSDVWIELMRFIGVWDFSPEQAIFGRVSTFLDKENVRVTLHTVKEDASRLNSIEVLCLNEPFYQGVVRYENDRLSIPVSIFKAVVERRLNVDRISCDYLSDVILIPQELEDLTESAATLPMFLTDELDGELSELEAERNTEAATDARLETKAKDREAEHMAEVCSDSDTHELLDT